MSLEGLLIVREYVVFRLATVLSGESVTFLFAIIMLESFYRDFNWECYVFSFIINRLSVCVNFKSQITAYNAAKKSCFISKLFDSRLCLNSLLSSVLFVALPGGLPVASVTIIQWLNCYVFFRQA